MGNAAVGLITMHHYHADLDNPENQRFVAAWKKEYGASSTPNFFAVGGYDGMAAIVHVVQALKGKIETDKALEALKGWKFQSPRGPIMIDPATRILIVMNEYLSEVTLKDGRLFQKVIGKIENVKDICKEQKIGPCGSAELELLRLVANPAVVLAGLVPGHLYQASTSLSGMRGTSPRAALTAGLAAAQSRLTPARPSADCTNTATGSGPRPRLSWRSERGSRPPISGGTARGWRSTAARSWRCGRRGCAGRSAAPRRSRSVISSVRVSTAPSSIAIARALRRVRQRRMRGSRRAA